MRIEAVAKQSVTIGLSVDEVLVIHNALNEVLNALDIEEFSTRMGAEYEDVVSLLSMTRQLITEIERE